MTQQQQAPPRLDDPPALPDLPDFEALRAPALERLRHFTQIHDAAQAEIDDAEAYLARLKGDKPPKRARKRRDKTHSYSESSYRSVLTAIGNHDYAGVKTAASEAGVSASHAALILRAATVQGHVAGEKRGRRWRYRITVDGAEFVTLETR